LRYWIRPLLIAGLFCIYGGLLGCAKVPPSSVSPVDIEETREDVKVLEKDLVVARDRAKQLNAELAARQAEHSEKKDKPDELRKKLDDLKKGSGRVESRRKRKGDDKDKDKDEDEEEKESA